MTRSLPDPGQTVAWKRRRLGCLTMLGLLAPVVAGAATLAEPEASAVRKVIQVQFGDAARFMAMVRGSYPMLLRPVAVSFLQAQVNDSVERTVSQPVHLRDPAGQHWRATYLLERQVGGSWRISGCVVAAGAWSCLTARSR